MKSNKRDIVIKNEEEGWIKFIQWDKSKRNRHYFEVVLDFNNNKSGTFTKSVISDCIEYLPKNQQMFYNWLSEIRKNLKEGKYND